MTDTTTTEAFTPEMVERAYGLLTPEQSLALKAIDAANAAASAWEEFTRRYPQDVQLLTAMTGKRPTGAAEPGSRRVRNALRAKGLLAPYVTDVPAALTDFGRAVARLVPTPIPVSPQGNRPDEWRATAVLSTYSRYVGHEVRLGVGYIGPDGSARRVFGGPMQPGPYAFTFPLASVIAASRHPGDDPDTITCRAGDRFVIAGQRFELRDDDRLHYPSFVHIPA